MIATLADLGQQSSSPADFETRCLHLLQREIGCDVAFFSTRGSDRWPAVVGFDRDAIERAVARGEAYAEDLLPVKRAALASRGVAVDTEVLGLARVERTRYFREVAAPLGGRHTLMAYVPWQGQVIAAVMLGSTGPAFSPEAVRRVESLLPTLGAIRAAFGLPTALGPLRAAPRPWLFLHRAGLGARCRVLETRSTASGRLVVRDQHGYREMIASDGQAELVWTRSGLQDPRSSGWPYVELFHVAAALAARRRSALFVGCGGAVALRQFAALYPGIRIDVVEQEPAVVDLARSWFDLDAIPRVTAHVAEGAEFIARARGASWDIVVIDAYDAHDIGAPFSKRSFFRSLRRAMAPGGAMGMNVIGRLSGSGPVRDVVRAARKAFADVRVLPVMEVDEANPSDAIRNVVVVGTRPTET